MKKHERLEEDFKIALSSIISNDIKNPNVEGIISVTGVKITPDQKYANVYVSIFAVKDKEKVLVSLKKSTGYIKSKISTMVKLRMIPEIIFELDNSFEYGAHIDRLLNDLKK